MKRFALATAVCILMIAVFPVICLSAVTGTVTDTDGNPVAGALITFIDESNPGSQHTDTTDGAGHFEIDLGITGISEASPQPFQLEQNYPNPFNPTTVIPFSLDVSTHVTLSVFNILGQRITTIIDTHMAAGNHTYLWNGTDEDGSHVSAGIYLYRLQSGNHTETRKMLLLDSGTSSRGGQPVATKSVALTPPKAETAQIKTYTVTITQENIVPYEGAGIVVNDGDEIGFIVQGIASDIPVIEGITFVTIPEVTEPYTMYSTFSVTLSSYEMSTTVVTNALYARFLTDALAAGDIAATGAMVSGASGDWNGQVYLNMDVEECQISFSEGAFTVAPGMEHHPVVELTWYGAKAFATYYGLDLPTESEWQYAASGGLNYEYGTTDGTINSSNANYGRNVGHTTEVGGYPSNPFGLYDMAGNVWEWCHDWYGSYPDSTEHDYTGVDVGGSRVIRGGFWDQGEFYSRAAHRSIAVPNGGYYVGFRVVRRPQEDIEP